MDTEKPAVVRKNKATATKLLASNAFYFVVRVSFTRAEEL